MKILVLLGGAASIAALKFLPAPWVFVLAFWIAILVFIALKQKNQNLKAVWVNLAVVMLAVWGLEAWLWAFPASKQTSNARFEGSYKEGGYFQPDDTLGFAPPANKTVTSSRYVEEQALYDVVYSIGDDGLRMSSFSGSSAESGCFVFFGGSFIFGEGVNDEQTIPFLLSKKTGAKTYNFGFHGYGAHQMLAALQNESSRQKIECEPGNIIYLGIMDHIARAVGMAEWDKHGPRYELTNDGGVVYRGHFDSDNEVIKKIAAQFKKSKINQKWFGTRRRAIGESDIELFVQIVAASQNEIQTRFPNSHFDAILWNDTDDDNFEAVIQKLQQAGVNTHSASKILPEFESDPLAYVISPHDDHPTAETQKLLADYIESQIIRPNR